MNYFARGLSDLFISVYQISDPQTQKSMAHLFDTWRAVFPQSTLEPIERTLPPRPQKIRLRRRRRLPAVSTTSSRVGYPPRRRVRRRRVRPSARHQRHGARLRWRHARVHDAGRRRASRALAESTAAVKKATTGGSPAGPRARRASHAPPRPRRSAQGSARRRFPRRIHRRQQGEPAAEAGRGL